MRFAYLLRFRLLAGVLLCWSLLAIAQDTRNVTEPHIPAICITLPAQLSAESNSFGAAGENKFDTSRIQEAIDHCAAGQAVELRPDGGHNAFLTAPLALKPGITLLVDVGVTLWASRNPRDYDRTPGSCGIVDHKGSGCKPLIAAVDAPASAVMGGGVIDGRGGEKILGQKETWWELAGRSLEESSDPLNQKTKARHNCPRIVQASHSDNFVLYGITLRNSASIHAVVWETNGFTAWGVKVDAPHYAHDADGIDPGSSTNVTITHCYIRSGDDNVAIIAALNRPASHITIAHNHFYTGHGMSIGSETVGGVSALRVYDLSIDGADNGIRIKSDVTGGGWVHDVAYQDVCIRRVDRAIDINPAYSTTAHGDNIPVFRDILLKNVRITGAGHIRALGYDAQHSLNIAFDNVAVENFPREKFLAAHVLFTAGPGEAFLPMKGDDVRVQQVSGKKTELINCKNAFEPYPDGPVVPALRTLPEPVAASLNP
jgi:polygalacturonase